MTRKCYMDVIGLLAIALTVTLLVVQPSPAQECLSWTSRMPSPRSGHATAYDDIRGRLVLFGGETTSGSQLGDTWEWDGNVWILVSTVGPPPTAGHKMAYDSNRRRVVLFDGSTNETWEWEGSSWTLVASGGPSSSDGYAITYDSVRARTIFFGGYFDGNSAVGVTWEWDGSVWTRISTQGPAPCYWPVMAFDSVRGRTVLFGGQEKETWEWDGSTWSLVTTVGPSTSEGHTMTYDSTRARVILFGGWEGGPSRYTWEWDGSTWTRTEISGPNPRYDSAMAYDSAHQVVVLFGGQPYSGDQFSDETWKYNGSDWIPAFPVPRNESTMVYDSGRGRTVLFGGADPTEGTLGDTWEQDEAGKWTRVSVSGPSARSGHAMAYDSQRGRTVLFGGDSDDPRTWEWDGNSWIIAATTGPPSYSGSRMAYDSARGRTVLFGGGEVGDLRTWEWDGIIWTLVATVGPSSRIAHAMIYDNIRGRIVLFGGYGDDGDALGDTWEWDGSTWTQVSTIGPLPRTNHAMAYDSIRGRAVITGGESDGWYYQPMDTWEWDGSIWSRLDVTGPEARYGHAMIYDSGRHNMVLFGGYGRNGKISDIWELVTAAQAQNTPIGTLITIQPMDQNTGATPATLTFSQVTQAGMTTLSTSSQGPPPPSGFQLGNPPIYYEITTTASYSGPIDVAILYAGVQYVNENALRLLHLENGEWVDCTTSVDKINKIIYGTVNSLSPFIVVEYSNRPPVLATIEDQLINEGQTLQIVLSATDPDNNALTYSASNLPAGAAFDPITQIFSWTPTFGQAGNYPNVLFTVTDNGNPMMSDSKAITITVNIGNRPPVLDPIGNKSVSEGRLLRFTVAATDPDGDTLTFTTGNLPPGSNFDSTTGTFSWTPDPNLNQPGNYLITFTVTDNGAPPLASSENITVTVNINHPPILTPIGNKSGNENQLLEFTITATDPDSDTLTYEAGNLPLGASFDPVTQTFSWVPSFDQAGNYPNIEFSVKDNGSPMEVATELITITVNNVNRAPIFVPIGTQQTVENHLLQFTVTANDPDGNQISYSTSSLPAGAVFNPTTQQFTWTPTFSQIGNYAIDFYATDNGLPLAKGTITVHIAVNVPPPCELANQIIDTVVSLKLPKNVENSYMANLKKVCTFVESGKKTPAINQLEAFIQKVQQDISHKNIGSFDGNNLINMANLLIAKIQS